MEQIKDWKGSIVKDGDTVQVIEVKEMYKAGGAHYPSHKWKIVKEHTLFDRGDGLRYEDK